MGIATRQEVRNLDILPSKTAGTATKQGFVLSVEVLVSGHERDGNHKPHKWRVDTATTHNGSNIRRKRP